MSVGFSERRAADRDAAKLQMFVKNLGGKGHREAKQLLQSVQELAHADEGVEEIRQNLFRGFKAFERRLTGIGGQGLARTIPQCLRDAASLMGNPHNQKQTARNLLPVIRDLLPTLNRSSTHPPSPS